MSALLASILLCGCAVGPNYHKPDVATPAAFRDLKETPEAQAQAASFADLPWWQVFQDPKLQELIRAALKQNYDLQLATNDKGWIGTAMDDIYDARLLIQPKTKFRKSGIYHITLEQLMREDPLKAVLSAGLRVERVQE